MTNDRRKSIMAQQMRKNSFVTSVFILLAKLKSYFFQNFLFDHSLNTLEFSISQSGS